jgi:hypothetical protein
VQHERQPLGRRQRLEHDEQRETDRVGPQHFVLGVGAFRAASQSCSCIGHIPPFRSVITVTNGVRPM